MDAKCGVPHISYGPSAFVSRFFILRFQGENMQNSQVRVQKKKKNIQNQQDE